MSQIFEALRRAEALAQHRHNAQTAAPSSRERRRSERRKLKANIRVYGHGPGPGPFFEENAILDVSDAGALLLMKVPVIAGQKLLLINEAGEKVQECRVVRTACRTARDLEVAVEFPLPQPDFWNHLESPAQPAGVEKRSLPRIVLPRGMSVTWKGSGEPVVSRVRTISAGGLFIAASEPAELRELIEVRFDVPAGEVNAHAAVRHSHPGSGMGVEFVAMPAECRACLNHLLEKLLR
jgi:hypothetical protein